MLLYCLPVTFGAKLITTHEGTAFQGQQQYCVCNLDVIPWKYLNQLRNLNLGSLGNVWQCFHKRVLGWGQDDLLALMASSHTTRLPSGATPGTSNQKRVSVEWWYTNLLIQHPKGGLEKNWVQRKQVCKGRVVSIHDVIALCYPICLLVVHPCFVNNCDFILSSVQETQLQVQIGPFWMYLTVLVTQSWKGFAEQEWIEQDTSNTLSISQGVAFWCLRDSSVTHGWFCSSWTQNLGTFLRLFNILIQL